MKVACIFATDMAATYKLATMILPQFEQGTHGVEVVGMLLFSTTTSSCCGLEIRSESGSHASRPKKTFC